MLRVFLSLPSYPCSTGLHGSPGLDGYGLRNPSCDGTCPACVLGEGWTGVSVSAGSTRDFQSVRGEDPDWVVPVWVRDGLGSLPGTGVVTFAQFVPPVPGWSSLPTPLVLPFFFVNYYSPFPVFPR